MREQAKVKINDLVRFHQPQEDVDTIRAMNNKYGDSGGQLYHDNCFHVQNQTPRMDTDYNDNLVERFDDVHIKFEADKDFLTSYYRDELKSKGLDPDYDVRLDNNYEKRNPTYYNAESNIDKYLGYGSRNDASGQTSYHKDTWENDFKLWVIGTSRLGVVLNESVLDAHSSMALSIYSPSNLADLLTDEVEQTREEKIAIAKQLLQQQQNSLN